MSSEALLRTCLTHRTRHSQTQTIDGKANVIDADLAPLLHYFDLKGHEALQSCQGLQSKRNFRHDGFIVFATYEAASYCMEFLMGLEWEPLTIRSVNVAGDPTYMVSFSPLTAENKIYDLRKMVWDVQQVG